MNTWKKLKRDPTLWDTYFVREKVIKAIRVFFERRNFHEIEAPILIPHPPAESYLDVFETTLLDRYRKQTPAYLSTSPEVALKKLMAAGLGDCYSITKSFRNMETQSNLHNPEFSILEWYRINATYIDVMSDTEELVRFIHRALSGGGRQQLEYQGNPIDLEGPWERMTVAEAFASWAHVDFEKFLDFGTAKAIARSKGYRVEDRTTWEELYNQIFLNEVEPHLGRGKPTILYEFPGSMAALAKKKLSDDRFAERFEFYISGLELGDCYSELTDWKEQQRRFDAEIRELRRLGKTVYEYDADFIDALKSGLPDCSGIAVGLDRLIMLFADVTDIADTLFFPGKELFVGDFIANDPKS